jgi:hypothetical protein
MTIAGPRLPIVVALAALGTALSAACHRSSPSPAPPPVAAAPASSAFPPKQAPPPPPRHQVIPPDPDPAEQPAAVSCDARDLHAVALSITHAHRRALDVARSAPTQGSPPTCHADATDKELMASLNGLMARTGACVAHDAPLDPQWSQLESSVAALDRCMDCTRARAERVLGCRRTVELTAAAQKATR